jgi:hypothetical protein
MLTTANAGEQLKLDPPHDNTPPFLPPADAPSAVPPRGTIIDSKSAYARQRFGDIDGAIVSNGHQLLHVPESDLQKINRIAAETANDLQCAHCGEQFTPREGSGGKPQKYCSPKCRAAAHRNSAQPANVAKVPNVQPNATWTPQAGSHAARTLDLDDDREVNEFDPGDCWGVPAQLAIECSRPDKDHVLIQQLANHSEENVSILIARSNSVRVARSILYAAGFRAITIAQRDGSGWVDLEDGDLP